MKGKGGYCQGVLMRSGIGIRKLETVKQDGMGDMPIFKNILANFTIQRVTGLEPYIKDGSKIEISVPPTASAKMAWPARIYVR